MGDNPAAGASQKDKEFSKWACWRWRLQFECIPKEKRNRLTYNVLNILNKNGYNTKLTVAARPKGAGVRFCDTITIATPIKSGHRVNKAGIEKCKHTNGQPERCVV